VRFLDREALREHVRSDRYVAGLIDPASGHLQPLKFTEGLRKRRKKPGAVIYENTPVLQYEEGAEVSVHTPDGVVRCAHLVLCGNAYIGAIALPLARRILGVGTYHHCLEADRSHLNKLLPARRVAVFAWILIIFAVRRTTHIVRRPSQL